MKVDLIITARVFENYNSDSEVSTFPRGYKKKGIVEFVIPEVDSDLMFYCDDVAVKVIKKLLDERNNRNFLFYFIYEDYKFKYQDPEKLVDGGDFEDMVQIFQEKRMDMIVS